MDASPVDVLREWHDFYVLIGTASATLVGLMFVAASIGASFFIAEREAGLRAFLTPTVLHFTAVLIACLVLTVPSHSWESLGGLVLTGGVIGLGYACAVGLSMRRGGFSATIDWEDRFWYVIAPVASYLLLTGAAILLLVRSPRGFDLLAVALLLLLLLGIRNAWDMTVWMVLRSPTR